MTEEMILEAREDIQNRWPENAEAVISACDAADKLNADSAEFLKHCFAAGGNWSAMFLSGIKALWPEVYEAIPADMGSNSFIPLCSVLILCGVDTSK